ncbi:MAG: lamin tail domain-containing protein [Saprospiraceae bacterium]
MKYWIYFLLIFSPLNLFSQIFQDDFSDGDFTNNPTWLGNTSDFTIFGAASTNELRLNAAAAGTSQIYAPVITSDSTVWEFYLRMQFSPSSSNQLRVYLMSDNSDFSAALNGYFLQIGETGANDAIEIYRQNGTTSTLLFRGIDGNAASDPTEIRVKIIRNSTGNWELFTNYAGGNNVFSEGTFSDNTFNSSQFFGFRCQYTSTRKDKFYFDDIKVSPLYQDLLPPVLDTVIALSETDLDVYFNENIASSSVQTGDFNISTIGTPTTATLDPNNPNIIHLSLGTPLIDNQNYTLTASNLDDDNGNTLTNASQNFTFFKIETAILHDILINEIMADPSPAVNLPTVEWVELYNNSSKTIQLSDLVFWNSSNSFGLPNQLLLAGDYILLCDNDDISELSNFGNVIGINGFSALSNGGDDLKIENTNGEIIHEVSYTDSWYGDALKKNGGYTLELQNPNLVCVGASNWQASNDLNGGTPNAENSVFSNIPDTEAPNILDVLPISNSVLVVSFNENIDTASALIASNYMISPAPPSLNQPFSVVLLNFNTVQLTFTTPFSDGTLYNITVQNIGDCSGNTANLSRDFTYIETESAELFDILITEIYTDFTPSLGLPEVEYVELYNRSEKAINLKDFTFSSNSTDIILPNYILLPDEYVALHELNTFEDFSQFGARLELENMPNLGNTSGEIQLINPDGVTISNVNYTSAWYQDSDKSDGGFSLEMISIENYCQDVNNWQASRSTIGGTPAKPNEGHETIIDQTPPKAMRAFPSSNLEISVFFDEKLTPSDAEDISNYSISDNVAVIDAVLDADLKRVQLSLGSPLQEEKIYTVTIQNMADCQNNKSLEVQNVRVALPKMARESDILINEILFNPVAGGSDFLEMYNMSDEVFNLKGLKIANTDEDGQLQSFVEIEADFLFFPNTYVAISENTIDIQNQYLSHVNEDISLGFLIENDLPSLPDASGGVIIFNKNNETIDALEYDESWHHSLLSDENGVSLERIQLDIETQNVNNWQSAAATVGYATPSYQNSQFLENTNISTEFISLAKKTFSPDDDGFEDFLLIQYELDQTDYSATISIFDANGRSIKQLIQNELLGTSGNIKWDGTNDENARATMGIYVILIELVRPDGTVKQEKLTCVLAGKL